MNSNCYKLQAVQFSALTFYYQNQLITEVFGMVLSYTSQNGGTMVEKISSDYFIISIASIVYCVS